MSTFLYRLARWCFEHRRRVLAVWLLLAVLMGALAIVGGGKENDNITIPGTESQQVATLLAHKVPALGGAETQVVMVSRGPAGVTSQADASAIQRAVQQMEHVPQVAAVTDPITTKSISPDGKEALATVLWKVTSANVDNSSLTALQSAAGPARAAGLEVAFGGQVYPGWNPKPSEKPEMIGIAIAFLILLVTFGALAAAGVTILNALIGVLITIASITALSAVTDIATVSTTVAIMLGMSTGIDYGLFIVSRHRHQLLSGKPIKESVGMAVGAAGSSVVFAGATVIAALVGLSVVGIPFLRTMGLLAAGAVTVSVLIAVTLLPAMLGFAGENVTRFVRFRRAPGRLELAARMGVERPTDTVGGRWGRFVVKHRRSVIVAGLLVVAVIALPVAKLNLGLPSGASQPVSNTSRKAYDLTSEHMGPGFNGALLVVADPVTSQDVALKIASRLEAVPDVLRAAPMALENGTTVIQVIPRTGPTDSATTKLVDTIRNERSALSGSTHVQLLVGGPTASNIDVSKKLSGSLPLFLLVVALLALVLLTLAFRTPVVPLKSIVGFLLSIAAALGAEVALFQWGWAASLIGVTKSPVTLSYLPTVLVAILFGLSSDYEVFVVSRIKEYFTKTGDPSQAVERGTGASLRVVSAAALIMFSIFVAFMTTNDVQVKPIAFSFALGVAVDAFVVRLTLVPAVMAALGRRAWYHPRWFAKYVPDPDIEGDRLEARLAAEKRAAETVPALVGLGSKA